MEKFDLKHVLNVIGSRVTDEQRQEQAELNRIGRTRLNQNSVEQRISRAKAQEISVLDSIDMLRTLPDSELKTTRLNNALDRLGELYAEQGRYAEAVGVTRDERRRAVYERTLAALTTPDGSTCECPDEIVTDRKTNDRIRVPAMQRMGQIVSNDGRLVTLKTCRFCDYSNTE